MTLEDVREKCLEKNQIRQMGTYSGLIVRNRDGFLTGLLPNNFLKVERIISTFRTFLAGLEKNLQCKRS